jgi:hypothetical protein
MKSLRTTLFVTLLLGAATSSSVMPNTGNENYGPYCI